MANLQASGGVTYTLLWENDSPTSTFAAQDITLSSDDYDYLDIYYMNSTTAQKCNCARIIKGHDAFLQIVGASGSGSSVNYFRNLIYTDDITYSVSTGYINTTAYTTTCIPYRIYGIKY